MRCTTNERIVIGTLWWGDCLSKLILSPTDVRLRTAVNIGNQLNHGKQIPIPLLVAFVSIFGPGYATTSDLFPASNHK